MAALVWVMMGIAIWHFTIFIPDRFWGGIVGAFLGAVAGAIVLNIAVWGAVLAYLLQMISFIILRRKFPNANRSSRFAGTNGPPRSSTWTTR